MDKFEKPKNLPLGTGETFAQERAKETLPALEVKNTVLWVNPAFKDTMPFKIEQGNFIKQFCGEADCYVSPTSVIDRLEILFHRPEPEPTVWGYKNGSRVNTKSYGSASVMVSSPQGVTKSICISATGQMSIKATCP